MDGEKKIKVGGILAHSGLATISVHTKSNRVDNLGTILYSLGKKNINLEFIVHNIDIKGNGDLTFCIDKNRFEVAMEILKEIQPLIEVNDISYHQDVAILSVFGPHFREKPMVSGLMVSALNKADIHILAISTSISSCSCLISMQQMTKAIKALNDVFDAPHFTNFKR